MCGFLMQGVAGAQIANHRWLMADKTQAVFRLQISAERGSAKMKTFFVDWKWIGARCIEAVVNEILMI